jgi:HEAT repeat protein
VSSEGDPTDWAAYRESAFGEPYMVWHDGPSFDELRLRVREDPATAERVLLEGIAQQDPLAAESVAEARFDKTTVARFLPVLTDALSTASGTFRVNLAQSLILLTGNETHTRAISEVLVNAAFWSDRIDAAIALGKCTPTIELIAVLMRGAQDPEYLVRYHSANALLRYAGESSDVSDDAETFELLRTEAAPDRWMLAASGLAGAASAALALRTQNEAPTTT